MDTIYLGGTVRTMEPGAPPAGALLTRDGVIAAVGTPEEITAAAGKDARTVDLEGGTLIPGFLDPHSHFSGVAVAKLQVSLQDAVSFDDIRARVAAFIAENHLPPGTWVTGQGYDHNRLAEGRHPDKALLDAAAPDHPVVLQHQSGHAGVFNSLALKELGITPNTPLPEGGTVGMEQGELTGYLDENPFIACVRRVPLPGKDDFLRAFRQAQEEYFSYGITTAQDGMLTQELIAPYRDLLEADALKLDIVAYADCARAKEICTAFPNASRGYFRHFRLGGYKIFLDGSPQARTAWVRKPYADGSLGQSTMSSEDVAAAVQKAWEDKRQLLAHCNGDAAAAQFLSVLDAAAKAGRPMAPLRPVLVHGQLLGIDQLPDVKRLGVIPSFFVSHIYHWGDVHLANLGRERADHLSPAGSALALGIPFTFHQDSPVLPPDMVETLWIAANRLTKNGVLLGPDQRIPVEAALAAVTRSAAFQYFEEEQKGALTPGKRADLAVLDRDPVACEPAELREIKVLRTVKDGETVWQA